MTGPPAPLLSYEHGPVCGNVAVHRDGPRVHVVVGPAPIGWPAVVKRTVLGAAAVAAIALAVQIPRTLYGLIVFALTGRYAILQYRRWRRGPTPRPSSQFVADPSGLSWVRPEWPQEWTCPREHLAGFKLHRSPPAVWWTRPVTAVLVLANGRREVLGQGWLAEATLIVESLEEGLGPPTTAAVDPS